MQIALFGGLNLNSLSSGYGICVSIFGRWKNRIGDPYSEKILDPWNDQYIPSTTYPEP